MTSADPRRRAATLWRYRLAWTIPVRALAGTIGAHAWHRGSELSLKPLVSAALAAVRPNHHLLLRHAPLAIMAIEPCGRPLTLCIPEGIHSKKQRADEVLPTPTPALTSTPCEEGVMAKTALTTSEAKQAVPSAFEGAR